MIPTERRTLKIVQLLSSERGVKIELLDTHGDVATLRRTTDLTHPECPTFVGRWMNGEFVKSSDATSVVETYTMHVDQIRAMGLQI